MRISAVAATLTSSIAGAPPIVGPFPSATVLLRASGPAVALKLSGKEAGKAVGAPAGLWPGIEGRFGSGLENLARTLIVKPFRFRLAGSGKPTLQSTFTAGVGSSAVFAGTPTPPAPEVAVEPDDRVEVICGAPLKLNCIGHVPEVVTAPCWREILFWQSENPSTVAWGVRLRSRPDAIPSSTHSMRTVADRALPPVSAQPVPSGAMTQARNL